MRRAERCPEGRRPRHGAWADALTQRSTFSVGAVLVPGAGIEPALPIGKGILSPLRLPFRHPGPGRTSRFLPVFLQAPAGSADERVHPQAARRGTLRRETSATTGKKKEKNIHAPMSAFRSGSSGKSAYRKCSAGDVRPHARLSFETYPHWVFFGLDVSAILRRVVAD